MPRVADINNAAAVPFPETSARTSPQQPSSKEMKSYQSPPTAPAGMDSPEIAEAGDVRRTLGQQSLLDHAGFALLHAHPLAFVPFVLEAAGIVNRHRQVVAEPLQHSQLLARKAIEFMMRSGKYADQLSIHKQRNRYFGERRFLTGDVIRVLAHIGRVTHLQGRGDVADHAFFAYFESRSLFMKHAAMNASRFQFAAIGVVQIKIGLHASECARHVVHDVIDQLVEIENGGDLARPFLQLEKMFDLLRMAQGGR